MNINNIREYAVIVNGGSGCIFQPLDNSYTYILTAKHNITNANNAINDLIRFQFENGGWRPIRIDFGLIDQNTNYFPHPNKDIAILKIEKINSLDKIVRKIDIDVDRQHYCLIGYPETRRNAQPGNNINWYRFDENLNILGTNDNQLREGQVPNNPGIEEIRGHSGGGLVKVIDGYLTLAGIQNRMANAQNEQLGRIEFSPLSSFDEIVALHPLTLSAILPPHMKCFSFLTNEAFNLDGGFSKGDIEYTKNYLKNRTRQIVESAATPFAIKEYFQKRLLLNNQNEEVLQTRTIWLTWLEFLTVLNVVKYTVFDQDSLLDIFNSYRLLHSNTKEDWSSELTNMVYSDYKGLKNKGLVIISVEKPPSDDTYIINNSIPQITQAKREKDRDKLNIDDGISFPFDNYTFIHIDYFKGKSIIKKHAEYREIVEDEEALTKLKEEYDRLFTA